jgi:acyl-CoA synthetase (AMP-forming)/AMP-acid ligase II
MDPRLKTENPMADTNIHIGEMLAGNARMYPDDVALIERIPAEKKRREIKWTQFDERANRFANALSKQGVKKADRVIQLMHNSVDWLIAYFGIIRTGAWVVPLNFRCMRSDIKYCADVAEPTTIVFGEEFTSRIDTIRDGLTVRHYVCAGREPPSYAKPFVKLIEDAPSTLPDLELTYDDPCGLHFTSGTTGQPKPILLTHKNMVCTCITENIHHGQTKKDNFILIPPLFIIPAQRCTGLVVLLLEAAP